MIMRQHLADVADDPVVGDLEHRRVGVGVDGDDLGGLVHAGPVLDRARDAGRDVEARPDRGAGLADLVRAVDHARVDRGARGADLAAEQVGQVAQEGELLGAADAGAAGDDDRGVLELDGGLAHLAAEDLQGEVAGLERRASIFSTTPLRLASAAGLRMTPSRTVAICGRVLRVDDRGDQVAAEGRPDLVEQVLVGLVFLLDVVVADLQVGAVGGEAAAQGAGDPRREVAAVGRAADQEDLRLAALRASAIATRA